MTEYVCAWEGGGSVFCEILLSYYDVGTIEGSAKGGGACDVHCQEYVWSEMYVYAG